MRVGESTKPGSYGLTGQSDDMSGMSSAHGGSRRHLRPNLSSDFSSNSMAALRDFADGMAAPGFRERQLAEVDKRGDIGKGV